MAVSRAELLKAEGREFATADLAEVHAKDQARRTGTSMEVVKDENACYWVVRADSLTKSGVVTKYFSAHHNDGSLRVTPDPPGAQSHSVIHAPRGKTKPVDIEVATNVVHCRALAKTSGVELRQAAQTALFSLGYLASRSSIYSKWTEHEWAHDSRAAQEAITQQEQRDFPAALQGFQRTVGLAPTGELDAATLAALDTAAMKQIATLSTKHEPGSKRASFRLILDVSNPMNCRLYVVGGNEDVAATYLISPGSPETPTLGKNFIIQNVLVRKPWIPPAEAVARGDVEEPPGLDNWMGILKASLGPHQQYLHGVPAFRERFLGRPASHGCVRMSSVNVIELFERFAEAGTKVTINRDGDQAAELRSSAERAKVSVRPLDAGREYLFGYLSGELGRSRVLHQ